MIIVHGWHTIEYTVVSIIAVLWYCTMSDAMWCDASRQRAYVRACARQCSFIFQVSFTSYHIVYSQSSTTIIIIIIIILLPLISGRIYTHKSASNSSWSFLLHAILIVCPLSTLCVYPAITISCGRGWCLWVWVGEWVASGPGTPWLVEVLSGDSGCMYGEGEPRRSKERDDSCVYKVLSLWVLLVACHNRYCRRKLTQTAWTVGCYLCTRRCAWKQLLQRSHQHMEAAVPNWAP